MTNEQLQMAIQMNQQGMSWKFIADYFHTTVDKLRTQRKHYYESEATGNN